MKGPEQWSPIAGVSAQGVARFLMLYVKVKDSCLQWTGEVRSGVAYMQVDGKARAVQRIAWALATGRPVEGREIGSWCGSKSCIRPDHLRNITRVVRRAA